jgi:hemerythrin-like domain-containing protein
MQHESLRIIRDEHQALAAVLRSMKLLLAEHRRRASLPDFQVLRAMLFYVDEFPQRLHHTKESQLLFPMIRRRSAEAAAVLDRLDTEHAMGETAIRDLEHGLLGFEMLGEPRRAVFETALDSYIEHYLSHMRSEEVEILPLALKVLGEDDWRELDAAFAANKDPLTGHRPEQAYEGVFTRIVNTLPAPFGLGPALA